MARTGAEKATGELPHHQVRLYIQATGNPDWTLLYRALDEAPNKTAVVSQLLMRGWLNLLHGSTAVERSMQLRTMGIAEDVICEIDAMGAEPYFQALAMAHAGEQGQGGTNPPRPNAPQPLNTRRTGKPAATIADAEHKEPPSESMPSAGEEPPPPATTEPVRAEKPAFSHTEKSKFGSNFDGGLA